jgi:toxin secretion/phage lysis holin
MRIVLILVGFMVLDIITGLLAAGKAGNLSSKISYRGMTQKVGTLIALAVCHVIDHEFPLGVEVAPVTTAFFIVNELLSVFENLKRMGVQLPAALMNALRVARPDDDTPGTPKDAVVVIAPPPAHVTISTPHADGEPAAAPAHTPASKDGQTSDDAPAL